MDSQKSKLVPKCHPDRPYTARGLCNQCYQREWYEKNKEWHLERQRIVKAAKPADVRRKSQRNWNYKANYGLSTEEVDAMAKEQDFRCKICSRQFPCVTDNLVVDHDHITGKVRGLLCDKCNWGLGNFKDSPDLLTKAIIYLEVIVKKGLPA